VAVFGSSQTEPNTTEWDDAERVGRSFALAGLDVVTGGYGGTMEAVSRGAAQAGGHVLGIIAPDLFPTRSAANPWVAEVIEASSLAGRIDMMMEKSAATLALPGSIGTAAELIISWNLNHIVRRHGLPMCPSAAVGNQWREVGRALIDLVGAGEDDIHWAGSADEGVTWILQTGRF
jgi:hypothetical protein